MAKKNFSHVPLTEVPLDAVSLRHPEAPPAAEKTANIIKVTSDKPVLTKKAGRL